MDTKIFIVTGNLVALFNDVWRNGKDTFYFTLTQSLDCQLYLARAI
jgi:hypothetical protein